MTGVFVTATALSLTRWIDDYHLFVLGALSFTAAVFGRTARRRRIKEPAALSGASVSEVNAELTSRRAAEVPTVIPGDGEVVTAMAALGPLTPRARRRMS